MWRSRFRLTSAQSLFLSAHIPPIEGCYCIVTTQTKIDLEGMGGFPFPLFHAVFSVKKKAQLVSVEDIHAFASSEIDVKEARSGVL